ncbi:MAG: GNAT family N-acetyltransferase [Chloroflexota bacterium]|nr:GNAT family N-acetyltransferase [Chloroflexota bacterium]
MRPGEGSTLIRPLEEGDYQAVRAIHVEAQREYRGEDWNSLSSAQQEYTLYDSSEKALNFFRGSGYSFVAERAGEVVGFVLAYRTIVAPLIWIRFVTVLPHHRRQGIASALYREVVKTAQSKGIDEIFATINPDNVPSIGLHEKAGFLVRDIKGAWFYLSDVGGSTPLRRQPQGTP